MTLVRNETQRHSAALKSAGQSPIGLLPLDGFSSDVPSFQLRPVFGAVSNRVPSGNAMTCFIAFGDKSRDNLKNSFQTQGFEFLFLSQRARRDDRVPICGVSRAIAGTAGHPCQANATLARPLGQPPPRLSCRRPASPQARTPHSAPAPRASSTRGRARAWR